MTRGHPDVSETIDELRSAEQRLAEAAGLLIGNRHSRCGRAPEDTDIELGIRLLELWGKLRQLRAAVEAQR